MRLFGAAEHELVVKTEDVVADDDVGVLALDEGGPTKQDFALGGDAVVAYDRDCFHDGAINGLASAQDDAVI